MSAAQNRFTAASIDVAFVRRLLAAQFPQWADLPITPAVPQGWDNRTFRLGADMSVRLPSAEFYTLQIEKEHRWLPWLARHLPLPIPEPLALGMPGEGYPWQWSIYRWLDGKTASRECIDDMTAFATDMAKFLLALQRIDAAGGPIAGLHSAFRGGSMMTYDDETRRTIAILSDEIQAEAATTIWEDALAAPWHGSPIWFHGDMAVGNLLVRDGRLSGVIDFGCCGVGDPACDVVIAWTLFAGESRDAFRATLAIDDATWARGRGWALWKAMLELAGYRNTDTTKAKEFRRVIAEIMADD